MVRQQAQVFTVSTIFFLAAIAVGGWFILAEREGVGAPPLTFLAAQLLAGVVVHLACDAVGYRTRALPPGTPAEEATRRGIAAWRSRTPLRTALCESIGVVSFAAAIVTGGPGAWPAYVTGAFVSVVLLAVHTWPWLRPVDRTRRSLERDGAESGLREAFRLPSVSGGAVQRL